MHRRQFLKLLAAATAVTAASPVLAACSSDNSGSDKNASNNASKNLRIAAIGGPGEGLNINEAMSTATWAALYAVYESLVIAGED